MADGETASRVLAAVMELARKSDVACAQYRPGADLPLTAGLAMFKHLLITTDGSPASEKALAQGLLLTKTLAAQATVVTVTEPWTQGGYATIPTPSLIKAYEKAAAGGAALVLEGVRKAAEEAGVRCQTRHTKDQHPAEGIIKAAKDQGCDLIIVGSHGRGPTGRVLLGSTSLKVLTFSQVAVLVSR